MTKLLPTRQKRLERPQDDMIQYTLSNNYKKKKCYIPVQQQQQIREYEIECANHFINLLDAVIPSEEKLNSLVQLITEAHGDLLFNSKQFVQIILERTPQVTVELLELYFRLTEKVNSFALRLTSMLSQIDDMEAFSLELLSSPNMDMIKAYFNAINKSKKESFIEKDTNQFVNWSTPMSKSITSRLYLLLQNDNTIPIQRFQYTLYSNTTTLETQDEYLSTLSEAKKQWLSSKHDTSRHDLFLLYSEYFYEFNATSQLRLIDHMTSQLIIDKEQQKYPDFYLLFAIYASGCQHLVKKGEEATRIMNILDSLNNAMKKSLEGSNTLTTLPFIMILTQLTLEYMHTSVGLTYAAWFESMFSDQKIDKLNKRIRQLLLDLLYKLIPYEMPAVLQIHAKVLAYESNYLKLCKSRLLELGMDSSLKQYPNSITKPNKQWDDTSADDTNQIVTEKIEMFLESKRIPYSLLEDTIFHAKWYQKTFLPQLFTFKGDGRLLKGRNELVKALNEKKKISDAVYKKFLKDNHLK